MLETSAHHEPALPLSGALGPSESPVLHPSHKGDQGGIPGMWASSQQLLQSPHSGDEMVFLHSEASEGWCYRKVLAHRAGKNRLAGISISAKGPGALHPGARCQGRAAVGWVEWDVIIVLERAQALGLTHTFPVEEGAHGVP